MYVCIVISFHCSLHHLLSDVEEDEEDEKVVHPCSEALGWTKNSKPDLGSTLTVLDHPRTFISYAGKLGLLYPCRQMPDSGQGRERHLIHYNSI